MGQGCVAPLGFVVASLSALVQLEHDADLLIFLPLGGDPFHAVISARFLDGRTIGIGWNRSLLLGDTLVLQLREGLVQPVLDWASGIPGELSLLQAAEQTGIEREDVLLGRIHGNVSHGGQMPEFVLQLRVLQGGVQLHQDLVGEPTEELRHRHLLMVGRIWAGHMRYAVVRPPSLNDNALY